jgi:hypothetical protein
MIGGECFRCGSGEHYARDCPYGYPSDPEPGRRAVSPRRADDRPPAVPPRHPIDPGVAHRGADACRAALGITRPGRDSVPVTPPDDEESPW